MTGPRVDSHAGDNGATLGAGRYVLGKILGEGGMATVYLARDTRLGVSRAIKVLTPALAGKRRIEQRFENEARAMAGLAHPAVVRVVDIAEEDGRPYIVMELLDGGTLWDWVEDHGPMPERMAVDALLPVVDAMEAAHAQGIVHRDLKPQNILLSSKGESRVTDFGIAHITDPIGDNLTRTGTVMGTWGYMSPEQRNSARSVDARSDVYALGATLAALVTGRVPIDLFAADQDPALLRGVSSHLATVIRRATRYGPDGRYPTAAALGEALVGVRGQLAPTPAEAPALGQRARTGSTAVPFEDPAPAAPPGTLAEFAPITTSGAAETTAPEPIPTGDTERPAPAPRPPQSAPEAAEPTSSRVQRLVLLLGVGAALAGIASWAALRPDTPVALPASADLAPRATAPAAEAPSAPSLDAPLSDDGAAPRPVTDGAPAPPPEPPDAGSDTPPRPASAAAPPAPAQGSPSDAARPDAPPAPAPDQPDDGAAEVAEVAEVPAGEPLPPPATPPPTAIVGASGDAEQVWLLRAGQRHELGPVPPGEYAIMARFPGGTAAPAGSVLVSSGATVDLSCVAAFQKCRPSR